MMSYLFFREIQNSKLPEMFTRRFIARAGGLYGGWKRFTENVFPILHQLRHKAIIVFINPYISADIVRAFISICAVLCMGAVSQVVSLIIQAVAITMIDLHTNGRLHDFVVHINSFAFISISANVLSPLSVSMMIMPLPLVEVLKIGIINQCNLTLRKRDLFHVFFQNKVPVMPWDKHDTTSRNILAHFHLLIPSEITSCNYTLEGWFS